MTTDQTPAIEVWARMLCAADVHVNDGDHPTWQQLSTTPGRGQDEYRKAARWLLPRLTVDPDARLIHAERKGETHRLALSVALGLGTGAPWDAIEEWAAELSAADLAAPADRAAVLREAADVVAELIADGEHDPDELVAELRRLADEAQQGVGEPGCAHCGHSQARHMGDAHERGCQVCWDSPGNSGWMHRFQGCTAALPADEAQQPQVDTLPAWLYQRFIDTFNAPAWDQLTDDTRAYWEHQARAVRRAVARGGFKAAGGAQQPEAVSPAYARLQVAAKEAAEAAHLHAMRGMRAVYQLCRRYGFGNAPIPAAEVLAALGLDENANTVKAEGAQQPEGASGPCDCGEGAVHYTVADCPVVRREAEAENSRIHDVAMERLRSLHTVPPGGLTVAEAERARSRGEGAQR